jgi:hypothetical protein
MTVFQRTADASDVYRESAGDQYARIVSSAESGNFIDVKNSTIFATTVLAIPSTMLRSPPKLTTKIKLVD